MANADYLVNEISLRLRHLPDNLQTPLVLQAMLQHSGEKLLPVVHDTIQEVTCRSRGGVQGVQTPLKFEKCPFWEV